MKWRIRYMVNPGDGLVIERTIEHPSDDIVEVAADVREFHEYWLFILEAIPS